MKIPKFTKRHRMQAATRRANPRAEEEFDGEPNIRLSSAIAVVLVLHVVAVSGIYAFNRLKEHRLPEQPPAVEKKAAEAAPVQQSETPSTAAQTAQAAAPKAENPPAPAPATAPVHSKVAEQQADSIEKQPAKSAHKDSGRVYTVAKGDNPVGIAKKFRVSYDELLEINKIKDPRKLQIGQKLHVPPSH